MPSTRQRVWFDSASQANSLASGATESFDLVVDMSDIERRGCTIMRIILTLHARALTVGLQDYLRYGIAVLNENVTVMPQPELTTDIPGWLLRDMRVVGTSSLNDTSQMVTVNYDLHAQRKFRGQDEGLKFILMNNPGGGSAIEYSYLARTLCLMG